MCDPVAKRAIRNAKLKRGVMTETVAETQRNATETRDPLANPETHTRSHPGSHPREGGRENNYSWRCKSLGESLLRE